MLHRLSTSGSTFSHTPPSRGPALQLRPLHIDGDGNVIQTFRFADPINDVADLKRKWDRSDADMGRGFWQKEQSYGTLMFKGYGD